MRSGLAPLASISWRVWYSILSTPSLMLRQYSVTFPAPGRRQAIPTTAIESGRWSDRSVAIVRSFGDGRVGFRVSGWAQTQRREISGQVTWAGMFEDFVHRERRVQDGLQLPVSPDNDERMRA